MKTLIVIITLLLCYTALHAQQLVSCELQNSYDKDQVINRLSSSFSELPALKDSVYNGVDFYKLTYNTVDHNGAPYIATAGVYLPHNSCDAIPLTIYCHGTEFNKSTVPSTGAYFSGGLALAGYGMAFVAPDYLGLGDGEGLHPYMHAQTEADAAINAALALIEFIDKLDSISFKNEVFISGYSQGGHAALASQKFVEEEYQLLDQLNIVGNYPLCGVYDLSGVTLAPVLANDSYAGPAFIPYIFGSYQHVYGNIFNSYSDIYDSPYDVQFEEWLNKKNKSTTQWYSSVPSNMYDFFKDEYWDAFKTDENHPMRQALKKNDVYDWKPTRPIKLFYCGADQVAVSANVDVAYQSMKDNGATNVEKVLVNETGNHGTCFTPAATMVCQLIMSQTDICRETVSSSISAPQRQKVKSYFDRTAQHFVIDNIGFKKCFIYNVNGQLVAVSENRRTDLSFVPHGTYFARILVNGEWQTKHFAK